MDTSQHYRLFNGSTTMSYAAEHQNIEDACLLSSWWEGLDPLNQGLKFELADLDKPAIKTKDVTYSHGPASLAKRRLPSHLKFHYSLTEGPGKATRNLLHLCSAWWVFGAPKDISSTILHLSCSPNAVKAYCLILVLVL